MYRKTYVEINENILQDNVREITTKYSEYQYYIGVVKNNAYHHGIKVVNSLIESGINYLAVSSLEEALDIRKYNNTIPILVLEPVHLEYIDDVINNNITLTITDLDYLEELNKMKLSYKIKCHIKIDSGMNRLGFKKKAEINKAYSMINHNKKLELEGIYTHLATSGYQDIYYDKQIKNFLELTKNIDLSSVPIVHVDRSLTFVTHPKLDFVTGIRLGIAMFGFSGSKQMDTSIKGKLRNIKRKRYLKKHNISESIITNDLKLHTAFSLYSEVIGVRKVTKGEVVGYSTKPIKEDGYILTIPIGYADGVSKSLGYVVIHNEKCEILDDCMDMIMVYSPKKHKLYEKVELFGNTISIKEVTRKTNTNAYHLFNQIQDRVPRVYNKDGEWMEIK